VLLQRSGAFTSRRSIHEMSVTEAYRNVSDETARPVEKQRYCTSQILGYDATDRCPYENIISTRQDFVDRLILFQGRNNEAFSLSLSLSLSLLCWRLRSRDDIWPKRYSESHPMWTFDDEITDRSINKKKNTGKKKVAGNSDLIFFTTSIFTLITFM